MIEKPFVNGEPTPTGSRNAEAQDALGFAYQACSNLIIIRYLIHGESANSVTVWVSSVRVRAIREETGFSHQCSLS
jgi:hypothetical protein